MFPPNILIVYDCVDDGGVKHVDDAGVVDVVDAGVDDDVDTGVDDVDAGVVDDVDHLATFLTFQCLSLAPCLPARPAGVQQTLQLKTKYFHKNKEKYFFTKPARMINIFP